MLSLLSLPALLGEQAEQLFQLGKSAAERPVKSYAMSGRLVLSKSGWGLLEVPNALVRGAFNAINVPGAELPPNKSGRLNAHISVLRPEDLAKIGGPDTVTEWGHRFSYTLGPLRETAPAGWSEMSKVWFIEVASPQLEQLRISYGLSATPKNNQHQFHITVAVRRKHVTREGSGVLKSSGDLFKAGSIKTVAVDLDGTLATYDKWRGEDHFGDLRPGAAKAMREFQRRGYHVIINTCRGDKDKIKAWLVKNDVPYDYINENPNQPPGASDKIFADLYIDDKGIDARASWSAIVKETTRRLAEKAAGIDPKHLMILNMLDDVVMMHMARRRRAARQQGANIANALPAAQAGTQSASINALPAAQAGTSPEKTAFHEPHQPPSLVNLSLRGGDQSICPRCGKPVTGDLYTDKKGWKFHRSCFTKGKGPVKHASIGGLLRRAAVPAAVAGAAGLGVYGLGRRLAAPVVPPPVASTLSRPLTPSFPAASTPAVPDSYHPGYDIKPPRKPDLLLRLQNPYTAAAARAESDRLYPHAAATA